MAHFRPITAQARPSTKDGEKVKKFYYCHHSPANAEGKYKTTYKIMYREDGTTLEYFETGKNAATKKQIEKLKWEANKLVALENQKYNEQLIFGIDVGLLEVPLADYWERYIDKSNLSNSSITNKKRALKLFRRFNETLRIGQLNREVSQDYYNFLLSTPSERSGGTTKITPNTANQYYNHYIQIVSVLKKDGVITKDITEVKKAKNRKTIKPYLSSEDLKILRETPMAEGNTVIRRAFLFGCYTGYRSGDLHKLKWSNIIEQDGRLYATTIMQKVNLYNSVPLNSLAESFIFDNEEGITRENYKDYSDQEIFKGYRQSNSEHQNRMLDIWIRIECKIDKKITPKDSRNAFAINFYKTTYDIVKTSRLLGHTDTKTTLGYLNGYGVNTKTRIDSSLEVPEF